jgi:hypothetical protein
MAMRFISAVALMAAGADAHAHMSNPAPRAVTVPGHRFQYEPYSDGIRNGQCQDGGVAGPIQATWKAGSQVSVDIYVDTDHGGHHELRLCQDPLGDNSCYAQTLALAVSNPSTTAGCPAAAPDSATEGCGWCGDVPGCFPSAPEYRNKFEGSGREYNFTATFQLPDDFTCDHCGVQWFWSTNNYGYEHFKSCHDVRIEA